MPKVRPLTKAQREAQAVETEIQRISKSFLSILGERRGRDDMTHTQMAELIGVCPATEWKWRNGELPKASFGSVVVASRKLGYRLTLEPISDK